MRYCLYFCFKHSSKSRFLNFNIGFTPRKKEAVYKVGYTPPKYSAIFTEPYRNNDKLANKCWSMNFAYSNSR